MLTMALKTDERTFEIIVIGGGVNGTGIAADLAMRGYKIALFEKTDLSSGTSSASSKLIHGGIRYLENYQFHLVLESLKEQQLLLQNAPHLVKPLKFILPFHKKLRPFWLLKLGVWLYEHLLPTKRLPNGSKISKQELAKIPLKSEFSKAISYYDCNVDDSRLVVSIALQAKQHGASIFTYSEVIACNRVHGEWEITILDKKSNVQYITKCKYLINATGPWAEHVATNLIKFNSIYKLKLVKGSHLITKNKYGLKEALILQNFDKRIIFIIPSYDNFLIIGTNEIVISDVHADINVQNSEIDYMLNIVNMFLGVELEYTDILHTYSGIRPLVLDKHQNASQTSRDYKFELDITSKTSAPCLHVYGGKLTTYRKLSENAGNIVNRFFNKKTKSTTKNHFLPGGDITSDNIIKLRSQYHFLNNDHLDHLLNNYGSIAFKILANIKNPEDLGIHFGSHLYQNEVDYLVINEWVTNVEDLIYRRSKYYLLLTKEEINNLRFYLTNCKT